MDDFYKGFVTIRSANDQPFLTLNEKLLTFSRSAIDLLEMAPHVRVSLNVEEKSFMIQVCEPDRFSMSFVKEGGKGKQILVRWGSKDILSPIREIIGEDKCAEPIRIWGTYYPDYKAIKFDLTDIQPAGR